MAVPVAAVARNFSLCYITAPTAEVADKVAAHLVGKRLAACVTMLPGVTSVYTWKGKVERESELLLMAKTQAHLVPQLIDAVKAVHPYDVPEVIAVPLTDGLPSYLAWIAENTGPLEATPEAAPAGDAPAAFRLP